MQKDSTAWFGLVGRTWPGSRSRLGGAWNVLVVAGLLVTARVHAGTLSPGHAASHAHGRPRAGVVHPVAATGRTPPDRGRMSAVSAATVGMPGSPGPDPTALTRIATRYAGAAHPGAFPVHVTALRFAGEAPAWNQFTYDGPFTAGANASSVYHRGGRAHEWLAPPQPDTSRE